MIKKCCHYQLEKTSLWYWKSWVILQRKTKLDFQSKCKSKQSFLSKLSVFVCRTILWEKLMGRW